MGLWKRAVQRIRKQMPKMDFVNKTHEDCANFDNGVCGNAPSFLNLTNLNPKGPACPHFKTKEITKTENEN